jgi:rSAM/selenodomain-associated transferase 2
MISVVIPALNEAANVAAAVRSAFVGGTTEVIVVDGGSCDNTVTVAESAGARVIVAEPNRARQMNEGAEVATGDVLLFLHADTVLPDGYGDAVAAALSEDGVAAGAFSLAIDSSGAKYRLVEAVVDIRSRRSQLPYGDQAIFVRADTFADAGGFVVLPIMEDYEFIRRMRRRGRVVTLPLRVKTSCRRWQRLGVVRTTVLNFVIIVAYHSGISPTRLAAWYNGAPVANSASSDVTQRQS